MSMSVGSVGITQEVSQKDMLKLNEKVQKLLGEVDTLKVRTVFVREMTNNTEDALKATEQNIECLENKVNLLSKSVNTCVSDVHELKHDVKKGTLLTIGAVSLCSIPILGAVTSSIQATQQAAFIMDSAVVLCEDAVALAYLGTMVGTAIFGCALVPLMVGQKEDQITNKLNNLDPTITYKQANDMHKLVIHLQDKHPDPGHYEIRHSSRLRPNGDYEYERWVEFVKQKNEMEPCAKFLLEKYQSEVAKDRMSSFETILERLKKWIVELESKIII